MTMEQLINPYIILTIWFLVTLYFVDRTLTAQFSSRCPRCNGRMKFECLDMDIDKMVYKCTNKYCGRQYI